MEVMEPWSLGGYISILKIWMNYVSFFVTYSSEVNATQIDNS